MYTYMGTNLSGMRLSLPIWLFEPTTALTRMVETFEFSDLLDRAASSGDPILRDSLVTAFIVSSFSNMERVRKPFNPVLGETYEFLHPITDMKFYAEQVSHHPPVSASEADGKGWKAGEVINAHAKYQGNSVEIINSGSRYIHLIKSNDKYTWTLPKAVVSNLFIGTTCIDHQGTLEVRNVTTGTLTRLEFAKPGWFSSNRYDVTGELQDATGERLVQFRGAWNRYLDSCPITKEDNIGDADASNDACNRLWVAGSHMLSNEEGGGSNGIFANCTKFTKRTVFFDADYAAELPPTDSRLRPDRLALEQGDSKTATQEKLRIEQRQRERMAAAQGTGDNCTNSFYPKYFRKVVDCEDKWEPIGTYWTESRSFIDDSNKRTTASLW